MRQRISHISRLLLVLLAVLVCQGAVAQVFDDNGPCCPVGYIVGEVVVRFIAGTPRERVDEIAAELGVHVISFSDGLFGPIASLCVPIGEESAVVTILRASPEVRVAGRDSVVCIVIPRCECCPCEFDCEVPGLVTPPCDAECVPDADADRFADVCDSCTDTDDDSFGDPGFERNFLGTLASTCPIDNCPDTVNPDQADLDGDGIGDACDRKLTICHRPPGKPAGSHTITIAERALPAHLAHGDVPGACVARLENAAGVTLDTRLLDDMTRGLPRNAAADRRLVRGRFLQDEASHMISTSLPPGLSVEDWRQIRGLIDVDSAGAVNPVTIDPTVRHEDAKLTASDAASIDRFGFSVALSGDTAVIGIFPYDQFDAMPNGSAYVFVRTETGWFEQAKLTASDAAPRDRFGYSVALSGDTAVVGAYLDDHAGGTDAGSAYVFQRSGTSWSEQAKLTASDAAFGHWFGYSVAVSGDTAVATAVFDSAYVFQRSGTGWSEQAKLTASDATPGDAFGFSVALSGDTAVVGAPFGVALGGTFAFIFQRSATSWSEQAKLTASDGTFNNAFGYSVAVSGDTVLVGAYGMAYVFLRSGNSWFEQAKLTASDASHDDFFGFSVAVLGDTAVVGAPFGDHAGRTNSGSVYGFVRSETTWTEQAKLIASDAAATDFFGRSVALSGDTVVVGAPHDDHAGGSRAGSAYVFPICRATDTTPPRLSVVLAPDTIWPPSHHMVEITATVTVSDDCTTPSVVLTSLSSNEPDDTPGVGDGKTTGDIQPGTDDFHFSLRAERAGTGSGRVYTAVYTATDGAGNVATETVCVVVPHDRRGRARVQLCSP